MEFTDINRRTTPTAGEFDVLAEVIGRAARHGRLSADEAQDFAQTVHLKLLERGYDAFRQFSGASSLRTYLTVVVRRMLVDWRRSQCGKWRPSASSRRLGKTAVALETLMGRDGCTLDEAIGILGSVPNASPASELARLAEQLPRRVRRRVVPLDELDHMARTTFEDPIEELDHDRRARALRRRLATALKRLAADDRLLLDLRDRQGQRIATIADALHIDSKVLYRRCSKVLRTLRHSLGECA